MMLIVPLSTNPLMQVYFSVKKRSVGREKERTSQSSYQLAQVRVARELQFGISLGSCRA